MTKVPYCSQCGYDPCICGKLHTHIPRQKKSVSSMLFSVLGVMAFLAITIAVLAALSAWYGSIR